MEPVSAEPRASFPRQGKTRIASWIASFGEEWDNVGIWKSAVKATPAPATWRMLILFSSLSS